jgi:hypothetical protein
MAERLANTFISGEPLPPAFSLAKRSNSQSLRTASSGHAS